MTACGDSGNDEGSAAEKINVTSTSVETEDSEKGDVSVEEPKEKEGDDSIYADALKETLPEFSEGYLELNHESYDFIKKNSGLLPAKTEDNINKVKEQSKPVNLKLLNKNVSPYYSTITSYEGYVVQISEEYYENGETASWVNVGDEEGNNYSFIMYKETGDILEEDYVKFWGVPVGGYSYETLDGGYQNAQIFFGAHIERAQ